MIARKIAIDLCDKKIASYGDTTLENKRHDQAIEFRNKLVNCDPDKFEQYFTDRYGNNEEKMRRWIVALKFFIQRPSHWIWHNMDL